MMKIIHITSGLKNGGAEAILYRVISNQINKFQHEVITLTDRGFYGDILIENGIKVKELNLKSIFSLPAAFIKLLFYIKSAKPNVIQTWMYHADVIGGIAAKILGVKKIIWGVHSTFLNPIETKSVTKIMVKTSTYLSYFIPNLIICCSETALNSHKKIGYCQNKLIIINNGVDINYFSPNSIERKLMRKKLNLGDDIFVIGMVARWHPVKDHETLFGAMHFIKNSNFKWKCILVGEGIINNNEKLNLLIDKYCLNEKVICMDSTKDISNIINALDLHILSSSSESFGNVTAEAMSCGIPCIMTDVGEAKNLLSGIGWIVKKNSPMYLADKITKVYQEFQQIEKWRIRKIKCRNKIVKTYNIEEMTRSYANVWSK